MTSAHTITYIYDIGIGTVEITRRSVGTSYPRNGNVGRPTEYFVWDSTVDGQPAGIACATRTSAYEHARAKAFGERYYDHPNYPHRWIGVRHFRVVQDEMRRNYRGRRKTDS